MDAVDDADPLKWLLAHSDCDGEIPVEQLLPIAKRLEELLEKIDPSWAEETVTFLSGLRRAHAAEEPVDFH